MPDKYLFPTTLVPALGTDLPDTYKTIRSGENSSSIITLQRWDAPKMRGGKIKFVVDASDLADIRTAWAEVYGSGTYFDFRYPWPDVWFGLYVGVGDGVEDTFDVPGYATSDETVYVNGVSATVSAWTTGENGRSAVILASAPADGAIITIDFTGQRQIVAVMSDALRVTERGPGTYTLTLSIDEV